MSSNKLEKYINEHGKECFRGVDENTLFKDLCFHSIKPHDDLCGNRQWALHTNLGSITVLNRMTGFGYRDTETGYRSPSGDFWLASGDFDIRFHDVETMIDAINLVKKMANNWVHPALEKGRWAHSRPPDEAEIKQ